MLVARQTRYARTMLTAAAVSTAIAFTAGCHRDPNVRKQKYLESGKRYEASGKDREAAIQFSNALKLDKNYADAYFELAKVNLKMGNVVPGYSELEKAVNLAPNNQQARITLGELQLAGHAADRAATQANAVLALNPNNADAYALLSSIAQTKGDTPEALKQIQHALSIDPNRGTFHSALALLEANSQDTGSAQQELEKAISLDPKNAVPRLLLSGLLQKKGDVAGAQKQLQAAIDAAPNNLQARAALATLYVRGGDQSKAEQTLQQALEANSDDPGASQLLASFYMQTKQLDRAVSVFADYNSKFSKSTPIGLTYAELLFDQQNFAKSGEITSGLLKKDPGNADVQALNANLLIKAGKTDEAFDQLKKAVNADHSSTKTQVLLASVAAAKGDMTTAEAALRAANKLDPANLQAATGLASVALRKNDPTSLQDIAEQTIQLHSNLPNGYIWRGTAEASRKEFDKAQADFQTALAKDPNNSVAYQELGQVRVAQGHAAEGEGMIEKALEKDPGSNSALATLVFYDMQAKQPAKAIARVQAQIAKSPNNAGFYAELAQLQYETKDYKSSLDSARKAMQLSPTSSEPVAWFVRNEIALGDLDTALSTQQNWVNSHTNVAQGYEVLGTLQEAKGNDSAAMDNYKKALQLDPNSVVASNNLALITLESGQNVDVALSLAQTARRNAPDSPDTADTLAWVYYYKQNYGAARDLLESALQASPDNATMHFHLGMIYSKLSDKANAQTQLKKAKVLAPNSKAGKDADAALAKLG